MSDRLVTYLRPPSVLAYHLLTLIDERFAHHVVGAAVVVVVVFGIAVLWMAAVAIACDAKTCPLEMEMK